MCATLSTVSQITMQYSQIFLTDCFLLLVARCTIKQEISRLSIVDKNERNRGMGRKSHSSPATEKEAETAGEEAMYSSCTRAR